MMRSLLRLFEKIVPHSLRIPVLAGLALLLLVVVWFYGVRAWNGVGNRFHEWRVSVAQKEIQKFKDEAAASKELATKSIAAYEAEKKIAQEEKAKRELAEKVLADRTKNTDQKLAAYDAAMRERPTITGPQNTEELCQRAAALGLRCEVSPLLNP